MSAQTQTGLSNINQTIFNLINDMIEIEDTEHHSDFNTRERKICANIKVYERLDDDNVKKVITDNNLSHLEEEILEEFNENRLNSVYNHVCENWVTGWKEQYEGNCDLPNFRKIFQVWSYASQKDMTIETAISLCPNKEYHFKHYFDKARKFNSYKSWSEYIIKKNKSEYEEFEKREKRKDIQI